MTHPYAWVRRFAAILIILLTRPADAQDGLRLELVETIPPEVSESGMVVEPQHIGFAVEHLELHFTWTALPESFGPEGFKVTLTASGRIDPNPNDSGDGRPFHTTLFGDVATTPSPAWAEVVLGYGEEKTASQEVTVTPEGALTEGQIVEIRVGTDLGPTFLYRYRVVSGGGAQESQIAAELVDCPPTIVISELPSLTCHLKISGFRHNTADPVQVILPSAIDLAGNHGNGLQLPISAGALDVSRMDDPHLWSLTLFACPGQKGAGVNCNNTGAAPGPLSVPIVVRQEGAGEVQVMLGITAVAGKNSVLGNGTGAAVTSTSVAAGPGQIGARIECPGTIFISALPSLNCHVVITGWLKDSAAPVRVLFPASIDGSGNHANGIQLQGRGEEEHFEWDNEESHEWGFFVFACPGQSSTGAGCFGNATTPGVQSLPIRVEQDGLNGADLTFMIDAQPHP